MKTSDFDFDLPEELIAQTPISKRDESRLLLLDKVTGEISHKKFKDITNTYVQTTMVKQNEETGESEEETITKKISLNIDDYTIYR